jgi:hypothetical protein
LADAGHQWVQGSLRGRVPRSHPLITQGLPPLTLALIPSPPVSLLPYPLGCAPAPFPRQARCCLARCVPVDWCRPAGELRDGTWLGLGEWPAGRSLPRVPIAWPAVPVSTASDQELSRSRLLARYAVYLPSPGTRGTLTCLNPFHQLPDVLHLVHFFISCGIRNREPPSRPRPHVYVDTSSTARVCSTSPSASSWT